MNPFVIAKAKYSTKVLWGLGPRPATKGLIVMDGRTPVADEFGEQTAMAIIAHLEPTEWDWQPVKAA